MTAPIPFQWQGDAFTPMPGHARRCDEAFVVGQVYHLIEQEDRSAASHRHFFACINAAWENLPEAAAAQFPTPEHLRKYALIKAGYADSRTMIAASKAEAQRLAAFIRPMDTFAVVVVSEATVTVFTAKSQSVKAMGRGEFQDSKQKVLDIVASMIGVSAESLTQNAGVPA